MLRPPEEFPTPLFRLACAVFVGGACAAACAMLVERWDGRHWPYYTGLAIAVVAGCAVALRAGTSGGRLVVGAILAALIVGAVFGIEVAVLLVTTRWE